MPAEIGARCRHLRRGRRIPVGHVVTIVVHFIRVRRRLTWFFAHRLTRRVGRAISSDFSCVTTISPFLL
ncbi:MAG: hypothetical protein WDN29_00920 [Methylovirgula sp.]